MDAIFCWDVGAICAAVFSLYPQSECFVDWALYYAQRLCLPSASISIPEDALRSKILMDKINELLVGEIAKFVEDGIQTTLYTDDGLKLSPTPTPSAA